MQLGCKRNKWNKIMLLCYDIRTKEIKCEWNENFKLWQWCVLKRQGTNEIDYWMTMMVCDALPSSLVDSNVSLNWKQRKSQELGHTP